MFSSPDQSSGTQDDSRGAMRTQLTASTTHGTTPSLSVLHPLLTISKRDIVAYMNHEHLTTFTGDDAAVRALLESPHALNLSPSGKVVKPRTPQTSKAEVGAEMMKDHMFKVKYDWAEDSSNADTAYRRNSVRLDLLPVLERVSGSPSSFRRRITTLSEQSWLLRQDIEARAVRYLAEALPPFWEDSLPSGCDREQGVLLRVPLTRAFYTLGALVRGEVVHAVLVKVLCRQGLGADAVREEHIQGVVDLCGESPHGHKCSAGRQTIRLSGNICVAMRTAGPKRVSKVGAGGAFTPSALDSYLEIFIEKLERCDGS
jgi:hypothetical protein